MKPVATDIARIMDPAAWGGGCLTVYRRHPASSGKQGLRGTIRSFDLASVFLPNKQMEHFDSVEALAEEWAVWQG